MLRSFRIPLLFLFIGSLLGVFLRWQFIEPTRGINYSNFLHGHSHIMFLGWVFNALYLAFVFNHIEQHRQQFFKILFYVLQTLMVAMLISFPLQGYGFWSISFSTLHTLGAFVFAVNFIRQTSSVSSLSMQCVRIALIFFLVSAAGPFSLGYLMANDLGATNWYNFSIYFYLHFQYNGFFFFGILALFISQLESREIQFNVNLARTSILLFTVACIPAYLLSTLWAKPGYAYNVAGSIAALLQLAGWVIFLKMVFDVASSLRNNFTSPSRSLLTLAPLALTAKFVLQILSAFPVIAQLAYELRPIVIAYLHLVLVGGISAFLFSWYMETSFIRADRAKAATLVFIVSFIGMECALILSPRWSAVQPVLLFSASEYIFGFSLLLSLSYLLFGLASRKKADKNHPFG
ncbi:MAG TPA: hypothetical protein VGD65_25365 [Chryseosolibacter sp.]